MRKSALPLIAAACLLAAGCGSETPEDQAEGVVKDWVKAINDRETDLCADLYTKAYVAKTYRSEARCRAQVKRLGPQSAYHLTFRSVDKTVKTGDVVTVVSRVENNGAPGKLFANLKKEDGKYRIDAIGGGGASLRG